MGRLFFILPFLSQGRKSPKKKGKGSRGKEGRGEEKRQSISMSNPAVGKAESRRKKNWGGAKKRNIHLLP